MKPEAISIETLDYISPVDIEEYIEEREAIEAVEEAIRRENKYDK